MPGSRKKTGDANSPHADRSEVRQSSGSQCSTTITETMRSSVSQNPPVLQRLARRPGLLGAGSRERSASRPPRRGGRATRHRLPGGSAPSREPHRLPVSPTLRHHRAGSAHAEGGACAGRTGGTCAAAPREPGTTRERRR